MKSRNRNEFNMHEVGFMEYIWFCAFLSRTNANHDFLIFHTHTHAHTHLNLCIRDRGFCGIRWARNVNRSESSGIELSPKNTHTIGKYALNIVLGCWVAPRPAQREVNYGRSQQTQQVAIDRPGLAGWLWIACFIRESHITSVRINCDLRIIFGGFVVIKSRAFI